MSATNGEPAISPKSVIAAIANASKLPDISLLSSQSANPAARSSTGSSVGSTEQTPEGLSVRSPKKKPASVRIRAARLEDLPQIAAVLLGSFYPKIEATHWLYWLMRIGIREDIRTRLKTHSSQYACLVAAKVSLTDSKQMSAGAVVGTIEIAQRPCETWRLFPPRRAYLSNLAVDPTYRRQGAAKQLLHTCERVALQWGFHHTYLHVMADNQAAQALYAQAGYQPFEVSNPIMAGLGLRPERLLLSKRLKGETNQ
ncbi:MAG: GNAT family N-acetyltransferase [Phormidesmis sp.]